MPIFWCLVDPPKTCSFVGLIKLCHLLTDLLWDAVDNFACLLDGFYYILTGESTSKAEKFDNFCRRKSWTCLLHKRDLRSALRDMYWNKPSKQKGVNLEGLGGWMLLRHFLTERYRNWISWYLDVSPSWCNIFVIWAFLRALRQRILRGRGSKSDVWPSSAQRKTVW